MDSNAPTVDKEPPHPEVPPIPNEPSTEAPSTEKPSTEKYSTEKPSIEKSSTENPSTETPSTEQPSTEKPSTEEPSSETPPSEDAPDLPNTPEKHSSPSVPSSDQFPTQKEQVSTPIDSTPDSKAESNSDTPELASPSANKSRKPTKKDAFHPRTLRPRSAGRSSPTGKDPDSSPNPDQLSPSIVDNPTSPSDKEKRPVPPSTTNFDRQYSQQSKLDSQSTPAPVMEAKGLCMRVNDCVFVTKDQLSELKMARLMDKKVKPFEELTFVDLRTYNRDQLRAYCFVYGMYRGKKTEMEADMAKYLALWNKDRPGFSLDEYVPTCTRISEKAGSATPDTPTTSVPRVSLTTPATSQDLGPSTPTSSDAKPQSTTVAQSASKRNTTNKVSSAPISMAPVAKLNATPGIKAAAAGTLPTAGVNTATIGHSQLPPTSTVAPKNVPSASRSAKQNAPNTALPRGFGTSFKQRLHARQAGTKFKAAYNGAGPAIVNIVENAAAYFEGKDSPEVILDQSKSFERYQFNVDMLTEIFDGPTSCLVDSDVEMKPVESNGEIDEGAVESIRKEVMRDVAKRMLTGNRSSQLAELQEMEQRCKTLEEETKYMERSNMRMFQRLERAETIDEVEVVKQEFEREYGTAFTKDSPPLVRRKLDPSLPPLQMSDDKCRILRFKVS